MTMKQHNTLNVSLAAGPARHYPIHIGHGLLADAALIMQCAPQRQICIVTNDTVAAHYLAPLETALADKTRITVRLPDGETHKTLATWASILDALVAARYDRDSLVIALGGGIVGDIAGFAAASYQRGIACLQIPTTLLAQVDSSVGGKTGVNHPQGKNLIGAFHQPQAVLIDTATLATLPPREFAAGMAEVIKYGLINSSDFFAWLEENRAAIAAHDPATLQTMIARCCAAKAAIVAADERESGQRALLNFGHTFGHARHRLPPCRPPGAHQRGRRRPRRRPLCRLWPADHRPGRHQYRRHPRQNAARQKNTRRATAPRPAAALLRQRYRPRH